MNHLGENNVSCLGSGNKSFDQNFSLFKIDALRDKNRSLYVGNHF